MSGVCTLSAHAVTWGGTSLLLSGFQFLVHTNHSSLSKYHLSSVPGVSVSCGLCKNREALLTSHWARRESASSSLSGHPDAAVPALLPLRHITQRICLAGPLFSEPLNPHWILSPGPTQLSPGETFQNLLFLAYIVIFFLSYSICIWSSRDKIKSDYSRML